MDASLFSAPRMVQVMDQAGRLLQAAYGDRPIPVSAIEDEVCRLGGYARSSVLPSDYCYNLVNKAEFSCAYPLFIWEGAGLYRYVGAGYPYTGPVHWRPKGGPRQVGYWTAGVCRMESDPRR